MSYCTMMTCIKHRRAGYYDQLLEQISEPQAAAQESLL